MINNKKAAPKSRFAPPIWVWVAYALALISATVTLIATASPDFAAFFNRYISGPIRWLLAKITCVIPFSLAEFLIITIPISLALIIISAIRKTEKSLKAIALYFIKLFAVCAFVFSLFVFTFGVGYHVSSLYDRFEIPNDGVTAKELESTALELVKEINLRTDDVSFSQSKFSSMPYTLDQMNDKLLDAYKPISQKYDFVQSFRSKIKPVMLSVPMSYSHTTGIYTFFTGEANLNVDFPDYTLPFTAAHELAHQRGIAREDEANFIAFLVGIGSGDAYIEYCAYINMFEYVASALYKADSDAFVEAYSLLSDKAKGELRAYSAFFDKYRESKVGDVSSAINNAYLVANGNPEGTKSYGLVVDLAVAYFNGEFDKNAVNTN